MLNSNRKGIVFIFVLLFSFSLIPSIVFSYSNGLNFGISFWSLLSQSALLMIILILLNFIFSIRTAFFLFFIFLLVNIPIELFHLTLFDDYITTQGIVALSNTNLTESAAFLRGNEKLIMIIGIMFFIVFFIIRKLPKRIHLFRRRKYYLTATGVLLLSIFIITTNYFLAFHRSGNLGRTGYYFLKQEIIKKYPINVPYRIYELFLMQSNIREYRNMRSDFYFNARQKRNLKDTQIYVLIIGESARYENYHINGYHRNTTPNLSSKSKLIPFSNFYSTANVTSHAVPLMITQATALTYERSFKEKSIVSLFKEAGFTTYWISSQNIFFGDKEGLYKEEVDFFYESLTKYDKGVLPILSNILRGNQQKIFIVINLFGNHYGSKAYPDHYNVYPENPDESHKIIEKKPENRQDFVDSYDNSVLYQDSILSDIINQIEDKNANSFVFFSSDHGESLFEAPDYFYGHGAAKVTKEQVHITAFFWYSDIFEKHNSELVKNINANKHKKLSSDNIFFTIADLSLIQYEQMDSSLSFCRQGFSEPKVRHGLIGDSVVGLD